jgi:hypothetical protein
MPANYVLLERIELNASAASVTFSNIPQSGYTDLKLVASIRATNDIDYGTITFNGSTTTFSSRRVLGDGSSASSGSRSDNLIFGLNPSGSTASTFSNWELYLPNYLSSNAKSFSIDHVTENNATSAIATLNAYLWTGTAAVNSIGLAPYTGSFAQYSTFSLYGLAALGTEPVIAPKALGGNIQTDGTYWYHTFLTTGAFVPQTSLSCSTLVIAGGGAGGTNYGAGGGGGAGGLVYTASQTISTSQTITIGAGATTQGALDTPSVSGNGSNSTLGSLTTATGGGGGASYNVTPGSGGSGGGAGGGDSATTGGSASPSGQGNAGGSNASFFQYAGAGGGGAGAVGGSASSGPTGGNGGAGVNTYSSWASATNTGASGYYAGGGGGGAGGPSSPFNGTPGSGGAGGGGAGATQSANATNGTINTGGGGGGLRQGTVSGRGGSGIVIIRYLA